MFSNRNAFANQFFVDTNAGKPILNTKEKQLTFYLFLSFDSKYTDTIRSLETHCVSNGYSIPTGFPIIPCEQLVALLVPNESP